MDPATTPAPAPASAACRVLVVDDNRDAALSMALLLSLQGYETLPAFDGIEALEAFDAFAPGVVLLDINLPRLDGFEVARRMRAHAAGHGLLLVATSGFGRDEDRARAVRTGFDAYLVKPVEPAALQRLLAGLSRDVARADGLVGADGRGPVEPPGSAIGSGGRFGHGDC